MATHIRPFDIGCEPSPSVPAETLLQDGWGTYLLFFAVSKNVGKSGYLDDLGVAVLECRGCVVAKFGYPNDEGRPEHPLYSAGMAQATSAVLEVVESAWAREVDEQAMASARRIWGARATDLFRSREPAGHFIINLKEKTFECLASSLAVARYCGTFDEAIAFVMEKFKSH